MEDLRYLPDDDAVVNTIAAWHQEAWGHLTGRSQAVRFREFDDQRGSDRIPLTVVAFGSAEPLGSASLLMDDMDTHPEWNPWLASVYVSPAHRRRGVGERLCRRIVAEAARLQVPRLWLFTHDQAPLYARMGWRTVCEEAYRGEAVTVMDIVPA